MKLSAQMLRGVVAPTSSGPQIGKVVALPSGLFTVVASVEAPGCEPVTYLSNGRQIIAGSYTTLPIMQPWETRLARLVKAASFSTDFSSYINDAIEQRGLPTDPSMDWSEWLEGETSDYLEQYGEDGVEEAVHNLLVKLFVEKDGLEGFSVEDAHTPTKLTKFIKELISRELDNSLTSYLSQYHQPERGVQDTEIAPQAWEEWETPLDLALAAQEDVKFSQFRREFIAWVLDGGNVQTRQHLPLRVLFDLILMSDSSSFATPELIQKFQLLTNRPTTQIPALLSTLGSMLVSFAKSGKGDSVRWLPLLQKLRSLGKTA